MFYHTQRIFSSHIFQVLPNQKQNKTKTKSGILPRNFYKANNTLTQKKMQLERKYKIIFIENINVNFLNKILDKQTQYISKYIKR